MSKASIGGLPHSGSSFSSSILRNEIAVLPSVGPVANHCYAADAKCAERQLIIVHECAQSRCQTPSLVFRNRRN